MRQGALIVSTALCLLAAWMLYESLGMAGRAGQVPIVVLVPTLAALSVQVALDLPRSLADGSEELLTSRELNACIIVSTVVVATELLGLAIGVSVCLMALLTLRARVGVPQAALAAAAAFLTIDQGIGHAMGMFLPQGRLWSWLGL